MDINVTHQLAPGYSTSPAHPNLAPDIHAMIVASEVAEFGEATGYALDELQDDLKALDVDRDAWIVTDPSGSVVGFASLQDRRHVRLDVEGFVHPNHTGRGVGTTLVRLSESRAMDHLPLAPSDARVVVHNWINAENRNACTLLEREGYTPFRYFFRMETVLNRPVPEPEWPDGITLQTCTPGHNERLFHQTLEEAMQDHWGHIPTAFEQWMERRTRSHFDPSLWFLALQGTEPVGAAICSISDSVGWVDYLGVRAAWRGRGLGMAFLRHAAQELTGRGVGRMALGVDTNSPTGATRLYERFGMHVAQQHAIYGKELRPGVDLAENHDV